MIKFIIDTLLKDAAVTTITGCIKPVGTNQGDKLPYVTVQMVSAVPTRCRGGVAVETGRVQVNAYATTYSGCQALYQAVRAALDGARDAALSCQWLAASDMYRDEAGAHGKAIDFQLITN